jgi:ATP-dependent DNA helicase DinG
LSDGATLEAFRARMGAPATTRDRIELSPFNFEKNMRVFVAGDAPEPAAGSGRLDLDWLADMISFCVRRVHGGSLVLFTSHADLRAVAERIGDKLAGEGRPVFRQGLDFSRRDLTQHFARAGNGVLFGTDSFWTGVDVPGPALSQVIMTRLPFENPSHPVLEARHEWVRDRGGNAFAEITLPEALVKFRQGVGRLIRTQKDCGTITILDSRVLRKPYGKKFLAALPKRGHVAFSKEDRDEVFQPLEAKR